MDKELNYANDLQIDGLQLDKEWLNQSVVFMRYSKALADKRDELARAEQRADVERAEADKRARQRHAGDEKKPTEGVINSEVLTDAEYKRAAEAVLVLKHEADILQAAVRAFDQRKDALENLVRLHGQNYFSGPTVPHDIGREFIKQTAETGRQQSRERVAERMRPAESEQPAPRTGRRQ